VRAAIKTANHPENGQDFTNKPAKKGHASRHQENKNNAEIDEKRNIHNQMPMLLVFGGLIRDLSAYCKKVLLFLTRSLAEPTGAALPPVLPPPFVIPAQAGIQIRKME
jgi:hypothetical protein